jgi:hypothetical protein
MLKILKSIFLFFSPYVNFSERKADKFFTNIKSTDLIGDIRENLLKLMQENMISLNLWMEKKFKGYKYLTKGTRRKMYANTEKIKQKFEEFCRTSGITVDVVKKMLDRAEISYPNGSDEQIVHIANIMGFLAPERYYHYIKTSSFGKLLNDPDKNKLEGDCNQIVTLYIYLFSLKFPANELQIKLLKEHVCLHFREMDIEATNGQFAKYREFEHILPVTEIISTNLLDIEDFREDVSYISPRVILKSAQLAFSISSLRTLVEKNLKVAYRNMAISSMGSQDFYAADFFASKSGDIDLINAVRKNQMVHEYNKLAHQVAGVRTVADAKNHKSDYQKMLSLTQKMGDSEMEKNLRDTLNKI